MCEGNELLANVLKWSSFEWDIGDDLDIKLQSGLQSIQCGRAVCRPIAFEESLKTFTNTQQNRERAEKDKKGKANNNISLIKGGSIYKIR